MKSASVIRKSRSDRIFDAANVAIMVLVLIVVIYPLYYTVIASISEPYDVVNGRVTLLPKGFTLESYQNVFSNKKVWSGYANTIYYTLLGTALNMILTIPSAYVLSRKRVPGRALLSVYFLVTMYFSGGLVPTYLIVKDLGLLNQPYTLAVVSGISVYNVIVTRVFFQNTLPEELFESARIDGASDFRMFFQIALPLSSSILAVMALFYGVARWNDYFQALIFVTDSKYFPLQLVLRNILIANQEAITNMGAAKSADSKALEAMARQAYLAETMKYALIFISSAPLLAAYPFVQKYFVKGVMIGSLKG